MFVCPTVSELRFHGCCDPCFEENYLKYKCIDQNKNEKNDSGGATSVRRSSSVRHDNNRIIQEKF